MAKYLLIVESPAKVKTIGRFLGRDYRIEASVGHIRDLPKSQMGVDVEQGFEPKYVTIRGKGEVINKLKKEAQKVKKVLLATDPDREGEAISWHLATLLGMDGQESCRITFNEITDHAVKTAIKSPRHIDMDLVNAQQARRILDRIVGYSISPLLWRKVRKGLSAGRVQSVATRLICDREEEIGSFTEKEFWSLIANLHKTAQKVLIKAKYFGKGNKKTDLNNQAETEAVIQQVKDGPFVVAQVKRSEKRKTPAPPFITSTLQQEASRRFGFSARKTMMLAQQLYEGVELSGKGPTGLVTYIRTDSTRISAEAMHEIIEYIRKRFGGEYLPENPRVYANKNAAQDAHEAIRPAHLDMEPDEIRGSLAPDQYKLYKLIWDRFTACQMAAAVYDTITADIDASGHTFKVLGSHLRFPGHLAVYTETQDEKTEEEGMSNLPDLETGDQLQLKKLIPEQHFTQPPARYTEAALVKAMEELGIGRPSTYASIISTILDRGYVEKDKKFLVPTDTAKVVNEMMKLNFSDIVDVKFTARMEKLLDEVEEGKAVWNQVLQDFYGVFSKTLSDADSKIEKVVMKDEETDIPCEKCGRKMVVKFGRFGKFLACPGFPECRNAKPLAEEAGVMCPKCAGRVMIRKSKKGRTFYSCENSPQCTFVSFDKPLKENCPECGSYLTIKFTGRQGKIVCSMDTCSFTRKLEKKSKEEGADAGSGET
ncbi:MAG TPA: type I DNA topoisomerase [Clostridiales bacterium]|nr:type I DNA topoisomerase [Clostridiales bacterium]